MTKLMYLTWGDDLATRLHDPALHARLAEVGVTRVQVNVDDDAVAGAMRIATDVPINAVVSVWTTVDGAPDGPVTDVIAGAVDRLAGYEVYERRPIPPPESDDGTRMDTLANIAVLRRPDELTREDYLHHWLVNHTPVAIATQATFGYVQNVVVRAITPDPPRVVDALVEELFPSAGATDMHAFYGSGGDDQELNDRLTRLMASVARFGADRDIDLVPTSRYVYALRRP